VGVGGFLVAAINGGGGGVGGKAAAAAACECERERRGGSASFFLLEYLYLFRHEPTPQQLRPEEQDTAQKNRDL
jgi:hypothetical protein